MTDTLRSGGFDVEACVEVRATDPRLDAWGLPKPETTLAAGFDLRACLDTAIELAPQAPPQLISSGIALSIGNRHLCAIVLPRSGLGHREGLVLANTVGLIDADYTDTVMISAWNRNPAGFPTIRIEPGQRIAQMLFVPVVRPRLAWVERFSSTAQSSNRVGGFGSTGTGNI